MREKDWKILAQDLTALSESRILGYMNEDNNTTWVSEQDDFDRLPPERQEALLREWEIQQESEMRAEFVMSWVCGGGDPADAGTAWLMDR